MNGFFNKVSFEPMSGCWLWTGTCNEKGYGIFNKKRAHRFSWMMVNGQIPDGMQIDHRCHCPQCVNPEHLRLATTSNNTMNQRRRKDNKSGYKGVSWSKRLNKWRAQIRLNGKSHDIGYFIDPHEAHIAYVTEARKIFGEFAYADSAA